MAWFHFLGVGVVGLDTASSFVLSPAMTNAAEKDVRHEAK